MSARNEEQKMRVNVGCGQTPVPGWRNFDNSMSVRLAARPNLTRVLRGLRVLNKRHLEFIDFIKRNPIAFARADCLPLREGSVEVLYSSHMIEHLTREEASAFLNEVSRVLQDQGILRLAVPDLSRLVHVYAQSGNANAFIEGTALGDSFPTNVLSRTITIATGTRANHQWMYDGRSLCELLSRHGFVGAEVLPAGTTRIPNPGPLNLAERSDESVYVEARRSSRS